MDGYLPLTKSFYGDFVLCPWHAHQIKVLRTKAKMGDAAWNGIFTHELYLEDYFKGGLTKDLVLSKIEEKAWPEDKKTRIWDLVLLCTDNDPVRLSELERNTLRVEFSVLLDHRGALCKRRDKASISMRMDRVWLKDNGVPHVNDLKTGTWEHEDNLVERHLLVLGTRALYPDAKRIEFSRFYCQSGSYPVWTYDFNEDGSILITHPKGSTEKWSLPGKDPLLFFALSLIEKANETPADPTPGPHCELWYGEPCQFLGVDCPLGAESLVVADAVLPVDPDGLSPSGLLRAIAESSSLPLTPEQASWAYSGGTQLLGFAKRLVKNLEKWSLENGPIKQGEHEYGWFTTEDNAVDEEFALGEMLRSAMSIEEIAAVVSIAKTNIDKKISKRKHGALRESLLSLAVTTEESKPKFGLLRKVENEGTEQIGEGYAGDSVQVGA